MRLKHVHISDYKNLKDFTLSFDNDNFLDVFVGKNGSGKSNFFEALIEIFRHLDEADDALIDFEYELTYEIEDKKTEVIWKNSTLSVNGKEQKTLGAAPKPDNILVYYSGHNYTVTTLIDKYESSFRKSIKTADASENRYFIGIGSDYKELLLTTILLQPEASVCRKYICRRLGIEGVAPDLKITLKRPYYALDKPQFDVKNNDDETQFWKAEGSTKDFLHLLNSCATIQSDNGPIISQGHQANDDKYIFYINCEKLRNAFSGKDPHELFNALDKLKVLEMLGGISVELALVGGEPAYTSYFSDGQFQSVYIYAITELFKTRHCLTLLDEPDSFLHPEWQHEFLNQIFEISDAATQTNHTLLSSHSASTISSSDESQISLFEIDGNTVKVSRVPKVEVITSLSAGLITFSESEARLNIQHVLSNTTGPVLFTEGITDEIILDTAWSKLYPDVDLPFEIQNAFDCSFLRNLIKRNELYQNHPHRTFFALYDFDEAHNDWNQHGDDVQTDPHKGLVQKHKKHDSYAILLPVPSDDPIKSQVINPRTGGNFGNRSLLTIELLFHGVADMEPYFVVDAERTDGFIKFVSDNQKITFAEEVVPTFDPASFEVFRPMFEFIKSKCGLQTPVSRG